MKQSCRVQDLLGGIPMIRTRLNKKESAAAEVSIELQEQQAEVVIEEKTSKASKKGKTPKASKAAKEQLTVVEGSADVRHKLGLVAAVQKLPWTFSVTRMMGYAAVVLAAICIAFVAMWIDANNTIDSHEAEIVVLKTTTDAQEATITQISTENTGYIADIEGLTEQVENFTEATAALRSENEQLEQEKVTLEQSIGQLKAENGDLSKKFRILSGPS